EVAESGGRDRENLRGLRAIVPRPPLVEGAVGEGCTGGNQGLRERGRSDAGKLRMCVVDLLPGEGHAAAEEFRGGCGVTVEKVLSVCASGESVGERVDECAVRPAERVDDLSGTASAGRHLQGLWPRAPYGVQAAARANTGVRRICSVGPLELPYRSREVALRDVEQLALAHGRAKISRPLRDRECPCGGEVMLGPLVEDAARGILRRAGAQQVVP